MSLKRKILVGLVVFSAVVITFAYAQVDLAMQTIQFELSRIGKSVLEARNKDGKWPANIEDLEGTEYFKMPYRKEMLEKGLFVVVTQRDDLNPEGDRSRVLAYDNGSLLCRLEG